MLPAGKSLHVIAADATSEAFARQFRRDLVEDRAKAEPGA
jgi:hypothetical protein